MIQFSFPVGHGQYITLQAERPDKIYALYAALGGDGDDLSERVSQSAADPELNSPVRPFAQEPQAQDAAGTAESPSSPSDPWAEDADADDDPWPAPEKSSDPTKAHAESSKKSSEKSEPSNSDSQRRSAVSYDNFGRKWTLNIPGAPDCGHGNPAARMDAKSKSGNPYSKWMCAEAAGEGWRDKCEFSEFVTKK